MNGREVAMQPRFVEMPAFDAIGMLIRVPGGSPEIARLWDRFVPRIHAGEIVSRAEPGVTYGLIGNYDPQTGMIDYVAAVAVGSTAGQPADMVHWHVPAHHYAVFDTTLPAIGETFHQINSVWLPTSGYQRTPALEFECYGATWNPADIHSPFQIYIPVVAGAS
jgi:AraC family transcriptional regulator